ncbi:MAG: hypothetical protein QOH64_2329, partial [Acidimicrobiaceae bacterium]
MPPNAADGFLAAMVALGAAAAGVAGTVAAGGLVTAGRDGTVTRGADGTTDGVVTTVGTVTATGPPKLGEALTDTRAPPSAITKTFPL